MSEININHDASETQNVTVKGRARNGKKFNFELPVLGEANVPAGVMVAMIGAPEAISSGDPKEEARVIHQVLEAVRGTWPEQGRILWSLDYQTVVEIFTQWFEQSSKLGGFDPKA